MKKGLKIAIIIFVAAILIVSLTIVINAAYYKVETTDSNFDECEYVLDDKGEFISNIPYGDYFTGMTSSGVDIRDFGAATTKDASKNTAAIQAAIDSLETGETLVVSGGEYSIGTIRLKSDMTLFIERNSALVSVDIEHKELLSGGLITANGARNLTITGEGTINGNSSSFLEPSKTDTLLMPLENFNVKNLVLEQRKRINFPKNDTERVNLVWLKDCENIVIDGIELQDSARWTCHIENSKGVRIENLIINNNIHTANADGVDIDGTSNVVIKNSFIATADDGICIKTTNKENASVDNVLVENCKVMSMANSFKIGTETNCDVKNVTVKDCYFFVASTIGGYTGLSIESADGAHVENILLENINMENVNSAFLIWLGSRNKSGKGVGSINGVTLKNIVANNVNLPSAITGCKHKGKVYEPDNIVISNCFVEYRDSSERLRSPKVDLSQGSNGYPEITRVSHVYIINHNLSFYNDLPVYGLFVRHAKNIDITNFETIPRTGTKLPFSNFEN